MNIEKIERNKQKEILPLTSLRFFAAFYLFVFHIHSRWSLTHNQFCCQVFDAGAVGMSLFFMLSGFVLTYRYQDQLISYKDYMINRFARIYPIYFVAALLCLPWFGAKSIKQSLLLVISNLFMIQAWFPQLFDFWNDGGSWSISTEAFFYVLFPFILSLLVKQKSKHILFIAFGFYFISVMPSVVHTVFGSQMTPWVYYAIPIYRLPEFVIGICLCLIWKNHQNFKYANFCILLSLLLMTFYLGSGIFKFAHVGIGHNWIVLPVVSIILVAVSSSTGLFAKILSWKVLVWAGKISYCFYSFQFLPNLVFMTYREKMIMIFPLLTNNKIYFVVAFMSLIALSALGHHCIEQPMQGWIRKKYKNQKSVYPPILVAESLP